MQLPRTTTQTRQTRDMRAARTMILGLCAAAMMGIGLACADQGIVAPNKPEVPSPHADYYNPNCGASYTIVTDDYDDLMAQYGIGTTVDTANVCETWVGNDYTLHAAVVGSSDNVNPSTDDVVQGTDYEGGMITPYAADGSVVAPSDGASGSTAFDVVQADASLRQASYDDPYYGIRSPGDGSCIQPPCPVQSLNTAATLANGAAGQSSSPTPSADRNAAPQFVAHGISRRGVRALVDAAVEISRSAQGHRRFQKVIGKETDTYILDKDTELLIGEEHTDSTTTMTVNHTWKLVNGVYVRDRTEISTAEKIRGRVRPSHTTLTFLNVRLNASAIAPLPTTATP